LRGRFCAAVWAFELDEFGKFVELVWLESPTLADVELGK
jgi:hypothetical protein